MVQEVWYQVRSNRFLELTHRGRSLTQAIPHTPPVSQCLQKIPLTLTPEAPQHKQNKHPKQKEGKTKQACSNVSSNTSTSASGMSQAACNSLKTSKNGKGVLTSKQNEMKSFLQYLNSVYSRTDASKYCYCL